MARLGATGRAAATYLVLATLQRGISLLILPFISHAMSPVEFGAASMLTATSLLLIAIIGTPLIQLIIRAATRGEANGPALLRVTGFYCYIVLPLGVGLASLAVALSVPQVFGLPGYIWSIELLAIGFQPAASVFALWVAQAQGDLRRFAWLSSTSVVLTATTKLVLVVTMQLGVSGWVLSDLISAVLSALLAVLLVRLPKVTVGTSHVRYAVAFTLPLIPHTAALWALTSMSRPVMAAVSSLDQVGLLSFGLSLASVAGLVLTEFNRATLPHYSRENFPAPTRETLLPASWQIIAALVVPAIAGAGIAVIGRWVFAEPYWPSFMLTGVLLVGQAAFGLYLLPMNYITQTAGLPKYSSLASGAGAMIILAAIPIVGPTYGAIGVAYATSGGYAAMTIVAFILTRAQRMDIAWQSWAGLWPDALLATTGLACSVGALAVPTGSDLAWILAAISLTLVLGATILTSRRARSHP